MSYQEEEERLRMIQAETERKKRELQMLQEEELRHIRELERIKQQSGSYESDYDPEMDSAFASVQQPRQSVQVPPQQPRRVQQPVQGQSRPTQPQPQRQVQQPPQGQSRPVQPQQQRQVQQPVQGKTRPVQPPRDNLSRHREHHKISKGM